MEDAVGWGSPRGSELALSWVLGTWGSACPSARGTQQWQGSVTAGGGGRDLLTLPRPWCGGTQGLIRDSRPESSVSSASLNWESPNAVVALVVRGLIAHPEHLHRGLVPVPVSPPWHMAG